MSIRGQAFIAGYYEHPERVIKDRSLPTVLAEIAYGALRDAGLGPDDIDGFVCSAEAPGFGGLSMADFLGLRNLTYLDNTELGGAAYLSHVGHAAAAIAAGKCQAVLIVMGGLPRSLMAPRWRSGPEDPFEDPAGIDTPSEYALVARRHMYEYGTTREQLAEVRVAASLHAQHNPNALLQTPVTIEEVLESPPISEPLHRLDCCVTTDGGGAIVVVSPQVARSLGRPCVKVLGHGETVKHSMLGRTDLSISGAAVSGPLAFAEAGCEPGDIDYVSLYDSFTITVLLSLEDLGFCPKGEAGRFAAEGVLRAPHGALPFNTDGGGLCNNHPEFRGGMIRTIEAVRQLREEANPAVQVPDCQLALVQGHGLSLGTRSGAATLILGREDA